MILLEPIHVQFEWLIPSWNPKLLDQKSQNLSFRQNLSSGQNFLAAQFFFCLLRFYWNGNNR